LTLEIKDRKETHDEANIAISQDIITRNGRHGRIFLSFQTDTNTRLLKSGTNTQLLKLGIL